MNDYRQLKPRRSPLTDAVKGIVFLAVLGTVMFLGWGLFFPSAPENTVNDQDEAPQFPISSPTTDEAGEGESSTNASITPAVPTSVPVELIGTQAPSIGEGVRVGSHPPGFTLQDLDGVSHSLIDHQGQVVLINFWTTWCPPCREEMPALQQTYEKYSEQGFVVLGINWTAADDPDLVGPYVEELGLTFPILLDRDSVVSEGQYNLLGLPTSVFVGRDGIIRDIIIGALELETFDKKISSMLEERL
ncbi:MAG: redoxin domain-containing protein [Anaerolineales bacterium]|nr:redoxin domain-containing protein [Anaerolineales bacterium]